MLKSGESVITWEYYDIFDNALGCKASTYPSSEILSTSIVEYNTSDSQISNITTPTESEEQVEVNEPPNQKLKRSVNKKNKNKNILSLPEYLFIKNQREENSLEIKKQLKEREIDAINNLAEAIRETANK